MRTVRLPNTLLTPAQVWSDVRATVSNCIQVTVSNVMGNSTDREELGMIFCIILVIASRPSERMSALPTQLEVLSLEITWSPSPVIFLRVRARGCTQRCD